jgi:multicomponent Na+:H+ antiporter subunit E
LPDQNRGNLNPEGQAPSNESPSTSKQKGKSLTPFILTFLASFVVWLILSGKFDLFHISLGIISCLIVAYTSAELLLPQQRLGGLIKVWLRFIRYLPWLLYQIFLANLHVMYLVLHPRMTKLIDPGIIRFKSKFSDEMSLFIFANSITLTPGTITVYVTVDGNYAVHAIDRKSGEPLPGEMEQRVANIMGK